MGKVIGKRSFGKKVDKAIIIVLGVFLVLYCISLLAPLYWMLTTSLKSGQLEYLEKPMGFPNWPWRFKNYADAFSLIEVEGIRNGVKMYYYTEGLVWNTMVYSVLGSFWPLALTTMCAYVLAKYKFKGRRLLYNLGIFAMLYPIGAEAAAELYLRKLTFTWNNMWLYILTSPTAAFSGIHFLVMYAAFKSVSWTYAEAVFIDGGGHYTVFFRIMLPMVAPMFFSWYILSFLAKWNSYTDFLLWLPGYPNLALGLFRLEDLVFLYGANYPIIMAGYVVVMIPCIILFLLTQRITLTKTNVGGLKE